MGVERDEFPELLVEELLETSFFPEGESFFLDVLFLAGVFLFIFSILYIVKLSIIAKIPARVQYMEK